jgi:hypothetical protein
MLTKYINIILTISSLGLGGCVNTSQQETVTSLPEIPKNEQVAHYPEQNAPYQCYFIPPRGWDIADPSKLSPRVRVCFIGKGSNNLLPSVNLATEEVDISLKAYIDIVKRDCESDPNCSWRDLGKYNTPLGEGRLTEREVKTYWGISRQIQLIVIKDQRAYILTAGALKEEFSRHYQDFEAVLKSLTITTDLAAATEKKEQLSTLIRNLHTDFKAITAASIQEAFDSPNFQNQSWNPFQQNIINNFTELGPYWQILLLRDQQNKLIQE